MLVPLNAVALHAIPSRTSTGTHFGADAGFWLGRADQVQACMHVAAPTRHTQVRRGTALGVWRWQPPGHLGLLMKKCNLHRFMPPTLQVAAASKQRHPTARPAPSRGCSVLAVEIRRPLGQVCGVCISCATPRPVPRRLAQFQNSWACAVRAAVSGSA